MRPASQLVLVAFTAGPLDAWPGLESRTTASLLDVNMINTDLDGHGGWRAFTVSTDARVVYVSSSEGNDANNGLSPGAPISSISHGITLLRDQYPDWLLLKRGDTWQESLTGWRLKGRSRLEPMVIGSYGSSVNPPKLETGNASGFEAPWDPENHGPTGAEPLRDLALVGLHFHAHTHDHFMRLSDGSIPDPDNYTWADLAFSPLTVVGLLISGHASNIWLEVGGQRAHVHNPHAIVSSPRAPVPRTSPLKTMGAAWRSSATLLPWTTTCAHPTATWLRWSRCATSVNQHAMERPTQS